ncbi:unnamed protein product [Prorocentrum cordatum]|uniref:Methyltransferase-like protein n=1 Tax=Prorocentrum cordatum TaxID=2364126 RepID=A0ABN9WUG2_9DINO|nr:unnamed protein product [Polarella glacialis]
MEELAAPLRAYAAPPRGEASRGGAPRRERPRWRPPRTHLQAELVRRRKDPQPSERSGSAVAAALTALQAGDGGAKDKGREYWDQFYRQSTVNFFKDRHYRLREEFAELMPEEVAANPKAWVPQLSADEPSAGPPLTPGDLPARLRGRRVILEVGCAVGNGVLPLLRACPDLFAFACDLSPVAVDLLRSKEEYQCGRCLAFVSDITAGDDQPSQDHEPVESVVPEGSLDFATLLFSRHRPDAAQGGHTAPALPHAPWRHGAGAGLRARRPRPAAVLRGPLARGRPLRPRRRHARPLPDSKPWPPTSRRRASRRSSASTAGMRW